MGQNRVIPSLIKLRDKEFGTTHWKCPFCEMCDFEKSFKNRKDLHKHIKRFHKIPYYTQSKNQIPIIKQRCGECKNCNNDNCGECTNCLDKPQFGGRGQNRHACINRKCMNPVMTVQDKNTKNECHICGKNFRNGYPLKLHIKTVHEKIKSFKCPTCDKALGSKNALKYHINGCGKEESMEMKKRRDKNRCRLCTKGFTAPQTLKQHIKIVHEGVKSFKCRSCGKAFSIGQNMKRHIKIHHKEQIFSVESSEEKMVRTEIDIGHEGKMMLQDMKTKVQITINRDRIYGFKIHKSPRSVILDDIKKHLLSKQNKFGITEDEINTYDFNVKTTIKGRDVLEEIDEDDEVLPLIGDQIELECWSNIQNKRY